MAPSNPASAGVGAASPEEIRARVRAYLGLHLDSNITDPFANAPDRLALIRAKLVDALRANGWSDDDQSIARLMDDLVGLGPLQKHMDDPEVSDILVNRWDEVYVERGGRLLPTPTPFRDQAHWNR
jgi:pilus assembly protein CpaF